jgi:hypothetical protein
MKTFSKAELRKAILEAESERSKHPAAPRPTDAQRLRLQKSRQGSETLVSQFLMDAGLDLKKLETLHERRTAELDRIVEKHKTDALRRASRKKDPVRATLVKQSQAWRDLAPRGDFFPYPSFSLDTPFLIWTTPLLPLDSAAVPFASWAKFRVATSESGSQKVSFYFYWPSPYTDYAVIDAATYMSATGHLRAHAPWTVGVNTSEVYATAVFGIWFGVPRDVWSPSYETAFLGATGAFGSTFTGGDVEGYSISAGVGLNETMFAVPPRNVVVFEVGLIIDYDNDDGNIEADFEHGEFQIACPVVVFSILNTPPTK